MTKQLMKGSELIISPNGTLYHINMSRQSGFPPRFLMVGDPNRVREVAKFFDDGVHGEVSNREYVSIWGKYKGLPVAAMGTGIGTDNTEIALVELHAVHEFRHDQGVWKKPREPLTLIRVGTSGSPQGNIRLGTIAVTEHAIGLDNTGLFYLHAPVDSYTEPYQLAVTPDNPVALKLWLELRDVLPSFARQILTPYVSTATPQVVDAIMRAADSFSALPHFERGITTSAPGFFAPQGRVVGRLNNVLIPDLQERLAKIRIRRHLAIESEGSMRASNNEMETSALLRIAGEILGYRAGALCAVIANRAHGEFITPERYAHSVDSAIKVGLEALYLLG